MDNYMLNRGCDFKTSITNYDNSDTVKNVRVRGGKNTPENSHRKWGNRKLKDDVILRGSSKLYYYRQKCTFIGFAFIWCSPRYTYHDRGKIYLRTPLCK